MLKLSTIALLALAAVPAAAQDIPRVLTTDEQAATAPAGEICGQADTVKAALLQQHFIPVAIMRTEGGTAVTLMATEDGQWVLSELVPSGSGLSSCYRGSGDTFTIEPPAPPKPGRES